MYQKGLLILTQPFKVLLQDMPNIFRVVSHIISDVLYVHVQPQTDNNEPFQLKAVTPSEEFQEILRCIYTCKHSGSFSRMPVKMIDLKVLLSHITSNKLDMSKYPYNMDYNIVLVDTNDFSFFGSNRDAATKQITSIFPSESRPLIVDLLNEHSSVHIVKQTTDENKVEVAEDTTCTGKVEKFKTYDEVVLGGTFDCFHIGHKVLISVGCIHCDKRLTVGVSDGPMNESKVLKELIEPLDKRIATVKKFINDIKPTIEANVVRIIDPYGPTVEDPTLQCIVVSEETTNGGAAVNAERKKKNMKELDMVVVDLIPEEKPGKFEDSKVSSSSTRKRELGQLIRPVDLKRCTFNKVPYRVGLTGGIASGKTSISSRLEKLGAGIIRCDELGHKAYERGTDTYKKIVKTFGDNIVKETGEIDRKKLGSIVFSDRSKMDLLNEIVWPKILELVEAEVKRFQTQNKKVVILDAAVLLEAGWDKHVHEVWTTVIPQEEAVKRIMERDKVTQKEAIDRIQSQLSNEERVKKANVILSTFWEPDYTQMICEKAWDLLSSRLI